MRLTRWELPEHWGSPLGLAACSSETQPKETVKKWLVPFWWLGEFTTHLSREYGGWIESDVHWGLSDLAFEPKRQMTMPLAKVVIQP